MTLLIPSHASEENDHFLSLAFPLIFIYINYTEVMLELLFHLKYAAKLLFVYNTRSILKINLRSKIVVLNFFLVCSVFVFVREYAYEVVYRQKSMIFSLNEPIFKSLHNIEFHHTRLMWPMPVSSSYK